MEDSSSFSAFKGRRRDYFRKFRFLFKLVGMPLKRNQNVAYRVYSLVFIFIPLFSYYSIRILDLLLMNDTSINFDRLLFPYASTVAFGKAIVFLWNRVKLAKLLDKLEQGPFLPYPNRGNEVEEENLQKNCMKIIKTQSIIYIGGTIVVVTSIFTKTMIKRIISEDCNDWEFLYTPITLLNVSHSPNYELWWFYEIFVSYIIGIQFAVIDAIVAAVLSYISFQFKMLQNNIRRIVEMSYNEMLKETGSFYNSAETSDVDPSMIPWKYLKKSLTRAINYHLPILSVANETEKVFNGLQLYLFLNTLGLLGVLVAYATPLCNPFYSYTKICIALTFFPYYIFFGLPFSLSCCGINCYAQITRGSTLIVCGQLLVSCFWGEQIMHESQEVGRAAFESDFVGTDLRFQKSLALIIRRSENPVAITAGKFTAVCLSSLTWILRAGYSASTVLSQVK